MNDNSPTSQSSSTAAASSANSDQEWVRPRVLLRRMRSSCASGPPIWKWSLPAWAGTLPDGRNYNTCRSAGSCRELCYARAGTYMIPTTLRAHQRNLQYVMDEPEAWEAQMIEELRHPRFRPGEFVAHVRVHDAGDWWSDSYLIAWLRVMRTAPDVVFYNYTKEVDRVNRIVRPDPPPNFFWRFSYGGVQDGLISDDDNHADVFPDEAAVEAAGYKSQTESDLLAAYGPRELGIAANNLPAQKRKQGASSFRALQRAADARASDRRHPRRGPVPGRPKNR